MLSKELETVSMLMNQTFALADFHSLKVFVGIEIPSTFVPRVWYCNDGTMRQDFINEDLKFRTGDLWLKPGKMTGGDVLSRVSVAAHENCNGDNIFAKIEIPTNITSGEDDEVSFDKLWDGRRSNAVDSLDVPPGKQDLDDDVLTFEDGDEGDRFGGFHNAESDEEGSGPEDTSSTFFADTSWNNEVDDGVTSKRIRTKDASLGKRKHRLTYCEKCRARFPTEDALDAHFRTCTVCPSCLEKFPTLDDLKVHIKSEANDCGRKCSDCGVTFLRLSSLRRHVREKHSNRPRPMCEICGVTFLNIRNLQKHKIRFKAANCMAPRDGGPRECELCGESVRWMKKHLRTVHDKKT